ncbi:MAG: HEAT repeat domain-containing protein, partial [Planctomycetales bacterium]|nr:HEAT repeat domain-containing protein [Planctomycetales bacterium]
SALRRADAPKAQAYPTLKSGGSGVDRGRLRSAISSGQSWLDANFSVDNHDRYPCYFLYALERYKSFEEFIQGTADPEPQWYQSGYEFLRSRQKADGHWEFTGEWSQDACATSFAVLFLLRSTQQSIRASLGQGTLVGGRGLPRDLSRVRLSGGKLVVEQKPTEVDKLLDMLGDDDSQALESLIDNPAALRVEDVRPEDARRLQQIVRSGSPEARLLAVRALAKMRSLDYAPTLIYALTDPDRRIVREARDGLRLVSRRFNGFGLEDNFKDDGQRELAIDLWKKWYRTVRPDAPPLP